MLYGQHRSFSHVVQTASLIMLYANTQHPTPLLLLLLLCCCCCCWHSWSPAPNLTSTIGPTTPAAAPAAGPTKSVSPSTYSASSMTKLMPVLFTLGRCGVQSNYCCYYFIVKNNVYSAMVLSVLLHGAAESWTLSRTQLYRLETLHNSYNNNNNRRLVTLAEHTSDHGRQTNSSTEEKGEQV